jgi:hypothetical protein
MGPDTSQAAGLASWQVEIIALGYQLGALMLPALAPVVAWAAICPGRLGLPGIAKKPPAASSAPG